ncbi:MAG: hypothetical protein JWO00_690 [Candidatus Parcubacteria bacterium]|nr:hypothetical protein [Candidatus Parcubacteria bacterium]
MYIIFPTKTQFIKFLVTGVTIAAVVVFTHTFALAVWSDSDGSGIYIPHLSAHSQVTPVSLATSTNKNFPGYPSRLSIPVIGIDAEVRAVGTTAAGTMATPGNFTDVAWYKFGTVPGMKGSAVIDGHEDNGLGLDGVFKHLSDVKIGDDLYVMTDSGTKLHFVVSDVTAYDYLSVPVDLIFNDDTGYRLRLITCSGRWVSGGDTYDKRLVVTAELKQG